MTYIGHRADFYEDDEDPKAIRAAFERGPKGLTAQPRHTATVQPVGATRADVAGPKLPHVTGHSGMGARVAVNG